MSNELIINSSEKGVRIALLNNKQLVECHNEDKNNSFTVGDLYLGTVKKVVPGLNAAFIDVGYEKDAFLHYLDLGPQFRSLVKYTKLTQANKKISPRLENFKGEPDINKLGKINQVLVKNQKVLVQIAKEPISSKGPRLACEISLAGRFLVLVPFSNTVSVSRKITSADERKRLKRLITSIKPQHFGVIIRTVAQRREVAELDQDLKDLVATWEKGHEALKKAKPRDKVVGETNRARTMLRDLMNENFDSVITDSRELYDDLKAYVKRIAPDKEKIVKLHATKAKLFEVKGIEKQLKALFGVSVSLDGGGYLIIEHTEALHVVDVNSGNKSNQESDQETTALNTNIMAAREIVRQLRLRDMGGIIVVDFIDMRRQENKRKVYEEMKNLLKDDKAKSVILPLSKFGLMQITRQRVRPEMNISTRENCPACNGTGKIGASILVEDEIEAKLKHIITTQNEKDITLIVHPFLHAYFTKGIFNSIQKRWKKEFKQKINIEKDTSLGITTYHILNKLGEEIETH